MGVDHLFDGDGTFLHRHIPLPEQRQHRILGDAGEDGVADRRGDHGACNLEQDVHRADFLDVPALGRIEPEDLGEAAGERLLLRLEARRVVRGRLRRTEPPRPGPRVPVGHRDLHRIEALGVIGADRSGDDEEEGFVRGLEPDVGLGRHHGGPHVQGGSVRTRDPFVVELEQGLDCPGEDGGVHFGQVETHGGPVEARRVVGRAEQVHRSLPVPVRLQPLEDRLSVMQDQGGGRELQIGERLQRGIFPTAVGGPAHGEHVVAVDLPEAEGALVRRLRPPQLRRRRLDPEVHRVSKPPPRPCTTRRRLAAASAPERAI